MPQFAIVDSEKINKDVTYEPPLVIAFGVDKHSVESKAITMGRTKIPPKGRNQAHHHSCEASFFIRRGTLKLYMGDERKEYIVRENQFVFIPRGGPRAPESERDRDGRARVHVRELPEQGRRRNGLRGETLGGRAPNADVGTALHAGRGASCAE